MRKATLLFFFTLLMTSMTYSQIKINPSLVNQTVIKLFDGIAALDMGSIRQNTTKDFLLLEDGELWNLDTVTIKLSQFKGVNFSRKNSLHFIKSEIKGNTAWVAYNNTADMTINGQQMTIRWLESAVLIKEGKTWKVKMLHSTTLKPLTH